MARPDAVRETTAATDDEPAEESREVEREFVWSDFVEQTIEELESCIALGEWPWSPWRSA